MTDRIPRQSLDEHIALFAAEVGCSTADVVFDRCKVGAVYRPVLVFNGASRVLCQWSDGYSVVEVE